MNQRNSVGASPGQVAPAAEHTLIAGRYRLGRSLGAGGMAAVYDAIDERLDRAVAIKILDEHHLASDDVHARFEAEARACAALAHPNIVAVFDFGIDEATERPYLVMERLPGTTLADEIARGALDEQRAVLLGIQVADALALAHAAGIVHRDVKPANVLDAGDGSWKVADFGIAKAMDASGGLTTAGTTLCTPGYVAPERLVGKPASPRSDLYSLGVVLYEALTGGRPFVADTALGVAHLARTSDPTQLETARPGVSPELSKIVHRALARDPSSRFKSARALGSALARLDHPDGASASVTVPIDTPEPTRTRQLPAGSAPALRARAVPSRRIAAGAAAVLATVVVLVLAIVSGGDATIPSDLQQPGTQVTTIPPAPTEPTLEVPEQLEDALVNLEEAVRP